MKQFDFSEKSDEELLEVIHSKVPGSPLHVAALAEKNKRDLKREFWRKDIPSWVTVGVSVLSLIISIIALVKAWR
jgi:hypothetical protein